MSDDPVLAALARLEAGQTSMRSEFLAELGKTRGAIMDRVDELQRRVDLVREDIAVSMGSSEAATRANDNTRADLRSLTEQFGIMWKQLKKLQVEVEELRDAGRGDDPR